MNRAAVSVILAAVLTTPSRAQVVYTVTDIGTLGGPSSHGLAVNDLGVVAGEYAATDGTTRAFRWSASTGAVDLGTLGGAFTQPAAINDAGQIAGAGFTAAGEVHAFRTAPNGRIDDPGADLQPSGGVSLASGINASGQVTGQVLDTFVVAYRTAPGGVVGAAMRLGTFGGPSSEGVAINASGQVAGFADTPGMVTHTHAFRTTATGDLSDPAADLGTLGGPNSTGTGINDSGRVVGYSDAADGHSRAFRTTATGRVSDPGTDLGSLPGFDTSAANGINALGVTVGFVSSSTSSDTRAFLFDDTGMRDLNGLILTGSGWLLETALCVSDTGYITGSGVINGEEHAFLLTPVPEPPGLLPVGAVLASCGVVRRRRRADVAGRNVA